MEPAEFHAAQLVRTETAAAQAAAAWRTLDSADDWPKIATRVAALTTLAQRDSASAAAAFAQDSIGAGVGTLDPRMFSGAAVDLNNLVCLPLDSYLVGAVVHTRSLYGSGMTDSETLQAGESHLRGLVRTQVADAARNALGTAIASTPKAYFYRVVQPPCCQRCAVLRDVTFAWNSAFSRHKNCDCMAGPVLSEEQAKFSRVEPSDVRDLTIAQREAIADGADMNQVINAQRGVKVTEVGGKRVKLTTEGTTKRSWNAYVQKELARQRGEDLALTTQQVGRRGAVANYTVSRVKPRLTPEAIYQFATTREEAVRLLARNGYIVGDLETVARLAA